MFRNVFNLNVNHAIVQITNRTSVKPLRSYHKTSVDSIARLNRENVVDGYQIKLSCQSARRFYPPVHGLSFSVFPRDVGGRRELGWRCGRSNPFPLWDFAVLLGTDPLGSFTPIGYQIRMYRKPKSMTEEKTSTSTAGEGGGGGERGGPLAWLGRILQSRKKDNVNDPTLNGISEQNSSVFQGNLTPEEVKNLKVAFAEGFIMGMRQGQANHGQPLLPRLFSKLLSIFTVLTIVLTLLILFSGSVFKVPMGKYQEINPEKIHVTFEDVKGVDEAKQELEEVVSFLKNPEKFSVLGGKLPKGVLLVGPPGTGKTLLARAVAGEAGVPFFHAAGPEFDEVLVGQGARRVRDLFKAAKENSPCVIFIDEIDSVGSKRTNSVLHPYANQTINQLLSEMDGFHQNEGIIVLGATNRRDDLDKALLRPGRFDVEVTVPIPDYTGRKQILEFYIRRILSVGIDIDMLARGTTGFTGADLENMVNQAALKAAIEGAEHVTMKYLENARDKVLMGPERKNRIPDEDANEITAYHEGGHAIVGYYTKDALPLHKVTIMPRGPSLGHTAYIPDKERYHVTKSQLLASMDTMMGGRAAEELVFGKERITSGASSDLKQATAIATHMVKDWGMSEKIGLRSFEGSTPGDGTNNLMDEEIRRLLDESYDRAKKILREHSHQHKLISEALLKYETLDADDIKAILMERKKE